MGAILDLPEIRARVACWSVKDYEFLGEQGLLGKGFELIRGVVIEKVSKSPRHRALTDRENASLYAEAGVAEYWIVLGEEKSVEVYRQPANGIYQQRQTCRAGETLVCQSVPGIKAPLAEWFA